ncbi:hypothetical protein GIB67_001924 [Kingdonia uniflora]|uniref:ribonuclease Z n=1 Tax=Kingdonia uniflora TaxID=39325 RepID=A0A7J7NVM5_9MAGN|nr:hypothetical protein GIB67_001924 [Kingdonia uniflora]
MPQILNLRLFFSTNLSSPLLSSFKPSLYKPLKTPPKPLSLLPIFSYSPRRDRSFNLSKNRRNNSTIRENKSEELMEESASSANESVGFNKRRAEGRDKNDRPKNLQLKVRKLNPINTISYVQILGTGMDTQDTSPSVLLFFDNQRFIFNAGEIDHIFLSRVCSETAGGLPGLLLTLAGMGDEGMSVKIWGPSDLKYLVDAMRMFIPNAAMIHTHSFGPAPNADEGTLALANFTNPIVLIDDEVVKISAILLRPSCSGSSHLAPASINLKPGDISVIYICELSEIKGKFDPAKAKALGLNPGPNYRELQLGNSVMSDHQNIMVHPTDVLGPSIPGPIVLLIDCPTLSHLQELLSIETLEGYYTDSVDEHPDSIKSVNCIIHLSPSSLTKTTEYQKWMKRFGEAQHIMAGHEIKNMEIPILKASARVTARLNYLCPQFFPAPGFWSLQNFNNFTPESISSTEGSFSKLNESISAENLLKFHLRPYAQLGVDKSGIPSLSTPTEIVDELLSEIPEIVDSLHQVNQLWHEKSETNNADKRESIVMIEEPWLNENTMNLVEQSTGASIDGTSYLDSEAGLPTCLENVTREDMEIVLLGTGSSQPSKYRNVSSIYINLFSKGSLLLDCGEGTLGQLKRRFGVKGADDAVKRLQCIWISHIHADHHTGLARILSLRRELLRDISHEPLLVIGPRQLKRFLDAYQRLEDLDMQFLDCSYTTESSLATFEGTPEFSGEDSPPGSSHVIETSLFAKGNRMQNYWKNPVDIKAGFTILKNMKKVLEEAGLDALFSVPVVHCPQAFGVVIMASERLNGEGKTIPGWKLVYSGDTRPCPALIEASQGATVLIHEATFEDGMVEEAIARNHSTTGEAIEVGDSAGVYRIILTHFSQRYPKIPVFDETHMHKTCIGFDLMSVNLADLPVLPKVLPYLKQLFRNDMMADEFDDLLGPEV